MRIDLNYVLENEDYEPKVGAEYEIAPGVWGKMKPPTQALQEQVLKAAEEGDASDLKVARMVLDVKGFQDDQHLPGMPSIVVRDFFSILTVIGKRLTALSGQSGQ